MSSSSLTNNEQRDERENQSASEFRNSTKSSKNTLLVWIDKLATKEDFFFLHKILAVSCLISFAWRTWYCLAGDVQADMGFALYPQWTMPSCLLHLALNLSSFQFDIPAQRITTGYRIWPEYRWHSLIFTCRALAIMVLYYYSYETNLYHYHPIMNWIIVMIALVATDVASWSVGKYHSKSIRELAVPAPVKFFFSTMQFFGTVGLLLGIPEGRFTTPFWHIIIVQGNAFLMTVRRKNLASHNGLLLIYSVGLVLAFTMTSLELMHSSAKPFLAAATIACSVAFCRFGGLSYYWPFPSVILPRRMAFWIQSKYVLWTAFGAWWLIHVKPLLLLEEDAPSSSCSWLWATASLSVAALCLLGYSKCRGNCNNITESDDKLKAT